MASTHSAGCLHCLCDYISAPPDQLELSHPRVHRRLVPHNHQSYDDLSRCCPPHCLYMAYDRNHLDKYNKNVEFMWVCFSQVCLWGEVDSTLAS